MSEQYVVYGKVGVCRVEDKRRMSFGTAGEGEYYVLNPLNDPRSSLYVPCDNEKLMSRLRPLMTKEQIDSLLENAPEQKFEWIEDKNERNARFRSVLAQDDRTELLRMIRCLYTRQREKVAVGKKLTAVDEAILQSAVHLLEQEFSCALKIPRYAVGEYVRSHMEDHLD